MIETGEHAETAAAAGRGLSGQPSARRDDLARLAAVWLHNWCTAGLAALTRVREEIDALNVYPVPDGDTGTNLMLTMQSVVEALSSQEFSELAAAASAMARGALLGARGNSGVILSQLLRGAADVLAEPPADSDLRPHQGRLLAEALVHAADLGYTAVAHPVEGTVLTVARVAAAGASEAARHSPHDPSRVAEAAAEAAAEALTRTPEQLPVLATAGVVDAGGRGLCVLLDALVAVLGGKQQLLRAWPAPLVARSRDGRAAVRELGSTEFEYEVQYLLDAGEAAVATLRGRLAELGDSLVIVGGDGLWNVHVHVNDVAAAVEYGIEVGRPHRLTITRFQDQMGHPDRAADGRPGALHQGPSHRVLIAVAAGEGLRGLFRQAGACTVDGGATNNPSTRELLAAVQASGAGEVILLPNDGNVIAVAERAAVAAGEEGRQVVVIPTRSPVQALAAVAVHNAGRPLADDVEAMTAAAGSTRWGEITFAVRAAHTDAGSCSTGDVLGLAEGEIELIGHDLDAVARELVDRLLSEDSQLVTLVTGRQAPGGLGQQVREHVLARHPDVDVDIYAGGQPHYPLLVGVE